MIHGVLHPKKHTTAGFKIVEVGTDKTLVSILEMDSINGNTCQKSCFDCLSNAMRSHIDNIRTPDLITAVVSEIPINTTTVFVEANVVNKGVIDTVHSVSNLTGLVFLNSTGFFSKNLVSIADVDRTKDLKFFRFSCTVDANLMDDRIKQEPLFVGFCLKIP